MTEQGLKTRPPFPVNEKYCDFIEYKQTEHNISFCSILMIKPDPI